MNYIKKAYKVSKGVVSIWTERDRNNLKLKKNPKPKTSAHPTFTDRKRLKRLLGCHLRPFLIEKKKGMEGKTSSPEAGAKSFGEQ